MFVMKLTHLKPIPPIESSCCFLSSYINSLLCIKKHSNADHARGKMVIMQNSWRRAPSLKQNHTHGDIGANH